MELREEVDATGHDPDRLWTCQRFGLCGKPGSGSEWQMHTKTFFARGKLRHTMKGPHSNTDPPKKNRNISNKKTLTLHL